MTKYRDTPQDKRESLSEPGNSDTGSQMEESQSVFHLRLFITGRTSRSQRAVRNIQEICEQHLPDHYELEVIDVSQQPEKTREYQILAIPTLLKELPLPLRKVVGDLSETEKVLEGLDIRAHGESH
ncbi:MAG: circadian clock KaiB family protein [Spirochaetota bacterium]